MDIKINGVNFNGQREVMYALKKAADESFMLQAAELRGRGPRPLANTGEARRIAEAKLSAYMDMAVYDSSFIDTVKNFSQTNLQKLQAILKPIKWCNEEVNPVDVFVKSLQSTVKNNQKDVAPEVVSTFIKNITGKV